MILIQLEIKDGLMTSLDRFGAIGVWKGSIPSDQRFSVSGEARMIEIHPIYGFTHVDL
jgi:hypothetical protein